MVYKVGSAKELEKLPSMDERLLEMLKGYAQMLSDHYGEDRDVELNEGGYILYAEPGSTEDEVKAIFDYQQWEPEFVEMIDVEPRYSLQVYVTGDDFGVVVIMEAKETSDNI